MDDSIYRTKSIKLSKLEKSSLSIDAWIEQNEKEGFTPLTYEIQGEFAIFFMVKKDELERVKKKLVLKSAGAGTFKPPI